MVQFIREKQPTTDWVTDRPPTMADTKNYSDGCVEVTYRSGRIGWEPAWKIQQDWPNVKKYIIAWRRIRPAYRPEGER